MKKILVACYNQGMKNAEEKVHTEDNLDSILDTDPEFQEWLSERNQETITHMCEKEVMHEEA